MNIVLSEIKHGTEQLVWDFDPIANKLVCTLPPSTLGKTIDMAFHSTTVRIPIQKYSQLKLEIEGSGEVNVHANKLEIENAREFIRNGSYTLENPGNFAFVPTDTGTLVPPFDRSLLFRTESRTSFQSAPGSSSAVESLDVIAQQELNKIIRSIKQNGATATAIAAYLEKQPAIIEKLMRLAKTSSHSRLINQSIRIAFPDIDAIPVLREARNLVKADKEEEIGTLMRRQPPDQLDTIFLMLHRGDLLDDSVGKLILDSLYGMAPIYRQTHQVLFHVIDLLNKGVERDSIRDMLKSTDRRVLTQLDYLFQNVPHMSVYRRLGISQLIRQTPQTASTRILSGHRGGSTAEFDEVTEVVNKLTSLAKDFAAIEANNNAIETRIMDQLSQLSPEVLAEVYVASEQNHALILGSAVLSRAIETMKREHPLNSSSEQGPLPPTSIRVETEEALKTLSNLASQYDFVEDNLFEFLRAQPPYILNLIKQSPRLQTLGGGVVARAANKIPELEMSSQSDMSSRSSRSTGVGELRSRYKTSKSSTSSQITLFQPPVKPKSLRLYEVLDKDNQTQSERRETFIHEKADFYRISKQQAQANIHDYPLHTMHSFYSSIMSYEKPAAMYVVKHPLILEFLALFDGEINEAWNDSTSTTKQEAKGAKGTEGTEGANVAEGAKKAKKAKEAKAAKTELLLAYFKTAVYDIMKFSPNIKETEREWNARARTILKKLEVLISDRISPKEFDVDELTGKALQDLKDHIKKNPEMKARITQHLITIRNHLKEIGKIELIHRKELRKIQGEVVKELSEVRGCHLFSHMLKDHLNNLGIRGNRASTLTESLTKSAIDAIKMANYQFVENRLKSFGLTPGDPGYEELVSDPSKKINLYTKRWDDIDYIYVGDPMYTNIQQGLGMLISKFAADKDQEKLTEGVKRLFTTQVNRTLSLLCQGELTQLRTLSAAPQQEASGSSNVSPPSTSQSSSGEYAREEAFVPYQVPHLPEPLQRVLQEIISAFDNEATREELMDGMKNISLQELSELQHFVQHVPDSCPQEVVEVIDHVQREKAMAAGHLANAPASSSQLEETPSHGEEPEASSSLGGPG
jgi:hypothetical protein